MGSGMFQKEHADWKICKLLQEDHERFDKSGVGVHKRQPKNGYSAGTECHRQPNPSHGCGK